MKLKPSQKSFLAFAMCLAGGAIIFIGMAMAPRIQPVFHDLGEVAPPQVPPDDTGGMVALAGYVLAGIGGLALAWQILMAVVRAIAKTAVGAVKGKDE